MSVIGSNILSGASGQGGYDIPQSLYIGDSPDSGPKLSRTLTSAGSVNPKFTFATWFKKGGPCTGAKDFFWIDGVSWVDMQLQISNDRANSTNAAGLVWNGSWSWDTSRGSGSDGGELAIRDHSAWYHLCFVIDYQTSPYVFVYFNGVLQLPADIWDNTTGVGYATNYSPVSGDLFRIGSNNSNQLAGMYFADTYFIEAQALAATVFGEFNEDTKQFVPIKYTGTYSGNSFFLDYADSGSLGTDRSGLGNNFTVTSIAARQQCEDSPTNNFAILNSRIKQYADGSGNWVKNGGRMMTMVATNSQFGTTIPLSTGKWYCEFRIGSGNNAGNGIVGDTHNRMWNGKANPQDGAGHILYAYDGNKNIDGTGTSYGATYTADDIIGMAVDLDASPHTVTFYKNNASQGTITFTGEILNSTIFIPGGWAQNGIIYFNGGTDSTFNATETAGNNSDGGGLGDFYYTPPSGYLAICTKNLPTPSIEDPGDHFNTILYSSDSSNNRAITGVGFQPDLLWLKRRDSTSSTHVFDALFSQPTDAATKRLATDVPGAAVTTTDELDSFDSDGFTIDAGINGSSQTWVAWNWKAGGTPTADNSASAGATPTTGSVKIDGVNLGSALAGTIAAKRLSANTAAGFSIIMYTGTGEEAAAGQTIAHGLSQAPKLLIFKVIGASTVWYVNHTDISATSTKHLQLEGASALGSAYAGYWDSTDPNASVITLGQYTNLNAYNVPNMVWCWHEVPGYSKIGEYEGNSNVDGAFLYTGFKPAWVMIKCYVGSGTQEWVVFDNKRNPSNQTSSYLYVDQNVAEASPEGPREVDFYSNGIKMCGSDGATNTTGRSYIYMAFADQPFAYANAR